MTFLLYLMLQIIAGIGATMLTGDGWLEIAVSAAWSACLWYGMIYYNGVLAEWAMKRVQHLSTDS